MKLLSQYSLNGMAKFAVGAAKHLIMCNDEGLVMAHGVAARTGEDEFITYWLTPWLDFLVGTTGLNVQGENLTGKVFLYQLAGPRSLDILEAATGESLRDIKFLRQRSATIAGKTVNILRMGMAGPLGYELHGAIEDAEAVYNAIWQAGQPSELRRLGWGSYCNYTEGGFPQSRHDFLFPWFEHPQLAQHLGHQLAVVAHLDLGEALRVGSDEIAELAHRLAARRGRHLRPWTAPHRLVGRFHSLVGVSLGAARNLCPGLAAIGIHAVDPLTADRVYILAADEVLVGLQVFLLGFRF